MLYIRSSELTHLSDGINRISANIWSSDFQVYILPVMQDITRSFHCNTFSLFDGFGETKKVTPKAISSVSLFHIIRGLLTGGVFSGVISKSFGH